jgi:hypothetical protein
MGFGDPDDVEYAHASDVVAWAIREIDRLREERRSISTLHHKVESLEAEIARLREERRWISVGERLPEDLRRVMVMAPGLYGAQVAWLLNGKWHDGIGYPDDAIDGRVTHWQPLPPGPEGDGNG